MIFGLFQNMMGGLLLGPGRLLGGIPPEVYG